MENTINPIGAKRLLKGNEAFGEAAIVAGCRYYFGYPITPQNELTEYMSRELGKAGGAFIQAESELAAISMAYGATSAGGRVMISSSSPGIALMQEGISFLCSADLPLVMINVSRGGPGIGGIQPGQADYFQATRGGGNGDYHVIVLAPASIQEGIDMIQEAFEIADTWRNPVLILADGMLGQMMEPVRMPARKAGRTREEIMRDKPWAIVGHEDCRERNVIRSLRLQPEELERTIEERGQKYDKAERELAAWESANLKDAEIVFVAFGTTSRIVRETMEILAAEGIRAGMIRPRSLWPFPVRAFDEIGQSTKVLMSVELSRGQLIQDVRLAANGRWPVALAHRTGGQLISPEEIVTRTKQVLEVKE
jgi:2-oxoglutarate ferredoxin oxidoreductase subunit alpha